jgi:hypothetical protein
VFDDSGPERGILNLSQDPATIHPIPLGKVLPIQAYVCLGAHRKNRLNEAQLNYVHAQGLLAHGFKTEYLPDPAALLHAAPGRMVPAKATRVSGDKLDVMASSYHVADQVYTTISVVKYPPFGTQFERGGSKTGGQEVKAPGTTCLFSMPKKGLGVINPASNLPYYQYGTGPEHDVPERPAADTYEARSNESEGDETDESGEESGSYSDRYNTRQVNVHETYGYPRHYQILHRDAGEHDGDPLYKKPRRYRSAALNKKFKKYECWDIQLREGEHFFIDGVHLPSNNINGRFIWFELDNGERYIAAQELLQAIKNEFKTKFPGDRWLLNKCLYYNIDHNTNVDEKGYTPKQIWTYQWCNFIGRELTQEDSGKMMEAELDADSAPTFWYCADQNTWGKVFDHNTFTENQRQTILRNQDRFYEYNKDGEYIQKQLAPRQQRISCAPRQPSTLAQIPLPKTLLSARQAQKPVPELATLQSRIDALESKLSRTKQEANTQHLLLQVLEKLEDSG